MERKEKIWDEILDKLIRLKVGGLISETEYEIMKDDIYMIVDSLEEK